MRNVSYLTKGRIFISALALSLGACEQEPWDPFGLNDMSVLQADESNVTVEEGAQNCEARFFYNLPSGKSVNLGCDNRG